ncbi:MAG TPA: chemotaxis response regulator protein-glutamate methylesterase [Acidimicrobiia bacterium]|jgi:two-component system chemotaxis response regulator CheB
MQKVRVLVVDDSVVIRRMLTEILSSDPAIEVAGTASNGKLAIQKLTQVQPDVVVMDVEMPEMTGLEALPVIRKSHPKLPVIMFSTLTTRGGAATLDALALGATDYVAKPANMGSVQASIEAIRAELVPKVKAFGGIPDLLNAPAPSRTRPTPAAPAATPRPRLAGAPARVDVVAIGVSTGGPKALGEVLPGLPAALPVPVVIVQHMPPLFTKLLADRLDASCAVRVHEGVAGMVLEPGHVYLAPGDFHMVVEESGGVVKLNLNQNPPENSCRPAVDVLFRSVVKTYKEHALATVLTGMGQDGLRGAELVRDAGGQVLAQDEATSVVWGMPGFVARSGLADKVVPLPDVAQELVDRVARNRAAAPRTPNLFSKAAP